MRRTRTLVCALALGAAVSMIGTSAQAQSADSSAASEWPTYGGNLASHRYSPLDQINAENFKDLEIAWRVRTDFLGPRPDTL